MPRTQFARYPVPPKLTMLLWSSLRAREDPGLHPGRLKSCGDPARCGYGAGCTRTAHPTTASSLTGASPIRNPAS